MQANVATTKTDGDYTGFCHVSTSLCARVVHAILAFFIRTFNPDHPHHHHHHHHQRDSWKRKDPVQILIWLLQSAVVCLPLTRRPPTPALARAPRFPLTSCTTQLRSHRNRETRTVFISRVCCPVHAGSGRLIEWSQSTERLLAERSDSESRRTPFYVRQTFSLLRFTSFAFVRAALRKGCVND